MKITGIDPSLTGLGLGAIVDGRATGAETIRPAKPRGKVTEDYRHQRLDLVVGQAYDWCAGSDLVVIEGPSFDSHDTMRQLAGLNWILRRELWQCGHRIAVVPPSSLKKFAGVGGRADKDAMTAAAREAFGIEIEDDNGADALWLAEVGAAWLDCPVVPASAERVTQLSGVAWPTSDLAA